MRALFGTKVERDMKKIQPLIDEIGGLEEQMKSLSNSDLAAKTGYFKKIINERLGEDSKTLPIKGEKNEKNRLKLQAALDEILPEAFAVVREVAWRTLKQRPYDVQLVGGSVLHAGKIAEMKTGEGKTLASTLPIYLNALTGLGVHVVTVNDYLASRDAEWMSPIYNFLGLTVGSIVSDMDPNERQQSYNCDIVYGTNNEFGFDYLRDNMVEHLSLKVQRGHYYCIVDEVDSILIDEARTPLIISGAVDEATSKYREIQKIFPRLKKDITVLQNIDHQLNECTNRKTEALTALEKGPDEKLDEELAEIKKEMKKLNQEKHDATINKALGNPLGDGDYVVDEESHTIFLTPKGIEHVESLLKVDNLYSTQNFALVHHIEQAIKANNLFKIDVDYVVNNGEVIIVDEFTGRLMPGRRFSDGLHQALEAKERVHVAKESQTLATITFQNYFRMYAKLSGMTGTAETEAVEFKNIYKLDVTVVPTNKPIVRDDGPDKIYRTENEKFHAISDEIAMKHKEGQPVLVGTISVEKSEKLSRLLNNKKIPHRVLNAKFHEKEAEIVAEAAHVGKVTIATNMAGRGTDIVLGGNPEFLCSRLTDNLLKNKKKSAVHDVIAEFVTLILLERDKELKDFMEHNRAFDEELLEKVLKLRAEIKAEQVQVKELGGLHILGTERHEARRIDNQLRGRSGRQGDPGSSRFYISMEDDLMRLFGGERLMNMMQRLGMKEDEQIEHPLISRAIANSQKKVEGRNFEIRKHLLKYDEVMNEQRTYIYERRDRALEGVEIGDIVDEMFDDVVEEKLYDITEGRKSLSDEGLAEIKNWVENELRVPIDFSEIDNLSKFDYETFQANLTEGLREIYKKREEMVGSESMRELERMVYLNTIDSKWKEHLFEMDYLKEGINWRSYAEKDPLVEYKFEGFKMFKEVLTTIDEEVISILFHVEITSPQDLEYDFTDYSVGNAIHDDFNQFGGQPVVAPPRRLDRDQISGGQQAEQITRKNEKVGRNSPCPCGSGKKYKYCCYPKYGR